MNWNTEWKPFLWILGVFATFYFIPLESNRVSQSILEALYLAQWYAREHVLLCLIPAFFIAGAITLFLSPASVMKYLGAQAHKLVAYGVASVSGTILAVCSCTVLPLFAGIYRMGAGIGPATAFLYAGPAINILAITLTARVLGLELGIARGVGAIIFSLIIGVMMQLFFKNEETSRAAPAQMMGSIDSPRNLKQNILYFASMVGILVFANWGAPANATGIWMTLFDLKWFITSIFAIALGLMLFKWFAVPRWKLISVSVLVLITVLLVPGAHNLAFSVGVVGLSITLTSAKGETADWIATSWDFAKQIMPLLFIGVFVAGILLGRVGYEGLIPAEWVSNALGGNSLRANFVAAFAGAFMYFATLTEIPILEGLMGSGMGNGPALALLLAGPALSLPNMLVINSILGIKKTSVFIALVIIISMIGGIIFGTIYP
jgi:uncharacterized protein